MDTRIEIFRNLNVLSVLLEINNPFFRELIEIYERGLDKEHLYAIYSFISSEIEKYDFSRNNPKILIYKNKFDQRKIDSATEFNCFLKTLIEKLEKEKKFTFDVSLLGKLCKEWPYLNQLVELIEGKLSITDLEYIIEEIYKTAVFYSVRIKGKYDIALDFIRNEVMSALNRLDINTVNAKLKQFCLLVDKIIYEAEVKYVKALGPKSKTILTNRQLEISDQIYGVNNGETLIEHQLELMKMVQDEKKRNLKMGLFCSALALTLALGISVLPYLEALRAENNKKDDIDPFEDNASVSQIDESFETTEKVAEGLLEVETVKRISFHK